MTSSRRLIFPALIAAGVLWGTTVPLSKVALGWMPPAWLAFARFALAGAILMAASWPGLRRACSPAILISGGLGYGGSVLLQNFGIERTSVTHAALLIGATPVLVAIIAAALRHSIARPVAWAGFGLSLAGVGFIASGQGSGSTLGGDALVIAAQLVSAGFTVSQARLLPGRDPVAVTGLQLMSAAALVLPVALTTEHHLAGSMSAAALMATLGLVLAGTVGPTALFAFGQSKVAADVAGAFLNIEPLVGAVMGTALFADPLGPVQIAGGLAIMAGIGLSSYQVARGERLRRAAPAAAGEAALAVATEPAALRIGPAAALTSLPKPGQAPSLVRRTRFPHLRDDAAARYARRLGPVGHASPSAGAGGRRSGVGRRPGGVRRSATGRRRDGDASPDRRRQRRRAETR
jgi:O-acetylserine/cysteine efflux transporter